MSSPHDSRDGSGLTELPNRDARPTLPDRVLAVLEILLAAGLVTGSLAWVPFASVGLSQEQLYRSPRWIALFLLLEASLLLLLLGCCQHLRGKSLKELGLRRQAYGVEVRLGMVLVPLLFLINLLMAGFFKYFLPRLFAPRNPLLDMVRTPGDLALLVIAGLLAGGIKEEVQRAFILRRFEMLLGSAGLGL
ncbi:MAG: hypothetical protein HY652_01125, partial [Acidobacteria bacterium]|nr:hypothetical protein [Acidobacteriota bacterium]